MTEAENDNELSKQYTYLIHNLSTYNIKHERGTESLIWIVPMVRKWPDLLLKKS